MHGARRNNPDQLAVAAQRETDVKQPPRICVSESVQPDLIRTMAGILHDQQGFIKEDRERYTEWRTLETGSLGNIYVEGAPL